MGMSVSVDSKALTLTLSSLDATLTKNTGGVGLLWLTSPSSSSFPSTPDWRRTQEHHRSAAAPTGRTRPSRLARANNAQTLARRDPLGSAGILQSVPARIRGREVLPDSTGSNSLSRF